MNTTNNLPNSIIELLDQKLKQNNSNSSINDIFSTKQSLAYLVEEIANLIMLKQRDDFLKQNEDYKNGFYDRSINTSLSKLNLNVPRTRHTNFFPQLLQKYNRNDNSLFELAFSLFNNGRSKQNMKTIINDFGLNFSQKTIDSLSEELTQKVYDFKNTQLPEKMFFVYIDAYHVKIRVQDKESKDYKKVKDAAIYVAIGIDLELKKRVLGYYINFGGENKAYWIKVFNDLIHRKLSKVLMFISDDFPGISSAIKSLFPNSFVQKCNVHLIRNIKRNLAPKDASSFIKAFKKLKDDDSIDFDEAISKFENLSNSYANKNKTFIDYINSRKEEYLNAFRFKPEIRKYINNTNVVENFNSVMEKARINLGGYFQSQETAEKTIYLIVERLHNNVWTKANPQMKHVIYNLQQQFNLTFPD